jgi:hypothetical protein
MSYITKYTISPRLPSATHQLLLLEDPHQMPIPGAARRMPRQISKNMSFVLSYCFFCFCHLCYPISAGLKTISRKDAHLMYSRYLRVSIHMLMIYCPLPHLISVRAGWGYHCCVLVWLLAFC